MAITPKRFENIIEAGGRYSGACRNSNQGISTTYLIGSQEQISGLQLLPERRGELIHLGTQHATGFHFVRHPKYTIVGMSLGILFLATARTHIEGQLRSGVTAIRPVRNHGGQAWDVSFCCGLLRLLRQRAQQSGRPLTATFAPRQETALAH